MATHVGDIFFDAKINRKGYDNALRSMGASAGKISAGIGRKIAVGLAGVGFAKFIKDATKAGASLNAMGTIIDASLPHMTKQVDEFAKRAGAQFGLSETQAKGFVGKFASMASAMGYTEEQAYKMSTALTGLAGDVASYYHISQDDAFAKLGAVFTGETESLKQLGVIMTQNALDAYALEHGYGRVTAQMSELEKTTLRYNFVLDRLKLASGDFAKYANTWSGSIATIKLNWSNFMAVMGQGIINILLPLLQLIARISNALSALASRFLGWTKRLRGIKDSVQGAFGKKTQKDLKTANTGIGNVGSGLGGAGKSAKGAKKAVQALKRELLGFDKITKLSGENGTTTGGTGTGGGGGVGGGGLGDIGLDSYDVGGTAQNYVDNLVEKIRECWEKKDFTELGALLASKLNSAMERIPWDKIKQTADDIGKSIGTFITGFVSKFDWGLLAKSISNGIETAITLASSLIESIDWGAFGKAVVDFIAGIDWVGLFKASNRLQKAIVEGIGEAIGGAFVALGSKVSDYIEKNGGLTGTVEAIGKALVKAWTYFMSGKWIIDNLIAPFFKGFSNGAKSASGGETAGETLMDAIKTGIEKKWNDLKKWFSDLPSKIKDQIGTIVTDVQAKLTSWKDALTNKVADFKANFNKWKDSLDNKVVDFKANFNKWKDSLEDKVINFKANLTKWSDDLKNKTLKKFKAVVSTWSNTIKDKNRNLYKFKAHISSFVDNIKKKVIGGFKANFTSSNKPKAKGGVYKNGRWSPIQNYATGGYPTGGQMFIARERGAELVGTLKGHTAVMNNDQIVASVSAGVARAISSIQFHMQAPPLASYSKTKAQQAETEMDTQQMVALLQALLTAVNALDLNVQLDGESIKNNTVRRINNHTRSTGQLELII